MMQKISHYISKYWLRLSFLVMGLGSLIWFLVRVIPKPSRAQYPCMKAAAPLASSFVSYILGIGVFAVILKKAKQQFKRANYITALAFVAFGLIVGLWGIYSSSEKVVAHELSDPQTVNQPIGEGKGVFPGRVVWVHNPDATNENCTNGNNDFWSLDKNADQQVISAMVSASIQQLTGTTNDVAAWNSIFHYYNSNHSRGDVGYTAGEKIVIKINLNGLNGNSPKQKNINTSPQVCLAILDQLINVAGVKQSDISIGDPNIDMSDATFKKCHDKYGDVHYWGRSTGREQVKQPSQKTLILSDGSFEQFLPKEYLDATYMINIPVLKKHHRAGISISSKNHFGSVTPFTGNAFHLHPSLPCPNATGTEDNGEYGSYRCFVDIMGHKDLGGKTILYLVDGLWGSINWGHPAIKWAMPPFNNDYPNSLFTSLDPVAIESVCFDFLYYEFDENHPTEGEFVGDDKGPFPHFAGTDDFLHQSADPTNWAVGVQYDPENDGTVLKSMGTHEHWNNAIDKQYTRNLSSSGTGIELFKADYTGSRLLKMDSQLKVTNYPNPAKSSTQLKFQIDSPSEVFLNIFSLNGTKVSSVRLGKFNAGSQTFEINNSNGLPYQRGTYNYVLEIRNKKSRTQLANKLIIDN